MPSLSQKNISLLTDDTPVRASIFTRDEFAAHAVALAASHRISSATSSVNKLTPRFEESITLIGLVHTEMSDLAARKEPLTPGSEWLLDNYHLVEEQIRNIRRHLPRGYYRTLPKLASGERQGFPRVYDLAEHFIMHSDAAIDNEVLAHFIGAYQQHSVLTTGELWAIPIMLRLALIEHLRRLVTASLAAVRRGKIAEQILQQCNPSDGSSSTQSLLVFAKSIESEEIFFGSGAADLLRQLRLQGAPTILLLQWFEERLREKGLDPAEVIRADQQRQASNQITIGNTVTSLRTLASLDWHEWFERMSPVNQLLSRDPIGAFTRCDFTTRDFYRHHIEKLARRSGKGEVEIAETTLALARDSASRRPDESAAELRRTQHVGYYLIREGRAELEAKIGYTPRTIERFARWCSKEAFSLYATVLTLLTVVLTAVLITHGAAYDGSLLQLITIAILFAIPCSEMVIQLVQWIITKGTSPFILPRFDFEKGIPGESIPEEFRTLVAINALLHDESGIRKLVEILEVRFLGNQDQEILYAILADLPDSKTEKTSSDDQLLKVAQEAVDRLNQRYYPSGPQKFFLLHRKRLWNASEGKFMGWERKRGKLSELNQMLLGSKETTFLTDEKTRAALSGVRFVLTLDTDSILPKGAAARLIGALAHPLNRPVVDPVSRTVIKGYGFLQPRIGTTITSAGASVFARLFSGHSGLDPYTKEVSDVYQDLFHEGSHFGKGIYDLHAFEETLRDRVPENSLLSHDLFEGSFARVALASHIELYDEFPSRINVDARRAHRWIRGDWQLLPWVFHRIPDAQRKLYPTPLSNLSRWKLIDNLRRSLIAPAIFFSLLVAWAWLPGSPAVWVFAAVSPYLLPRLLQLCDMLLNTPWMQASPYSLKRLAREIGLSLSTVAIQLTFLPFQAFMMMHAIGITLGRLFITRRHFLEWQPAAVTERSAGNTLPAFVRDMAAAPLLAIFSGVLIELVSPDTMAQALPFLTLWLLSPVVGFVVSRPQSHTTRAISDGDREYLEDIAFDTWRYFDNLMDSSQNYLIPDNLQMKPTTVIAERTSPTNISLSLLGTISGFDFGFIPLFPVIDRISNVLETLGRLERYRGHFLNWYQTRTLASLYPRYISTVDSGNLVGFLIAARSAVRSFQFAAIVRPEHLRFVRRKSSQLRSAVKTDDELKRIIGVFEAGLPNEVRTIGTLGRAVRDIISFRDAIDAERRRRTLSTEINVQIDKAIGNLEPFTSLQPYAHGITTAESLIGSIDPVMLSVENDRLVRIRSLFESEPTLFNLSALFDQLADISIEKLAASDLSVSRSENGPSTRDIVVECSRLLTDYRKQVASIVQTITQIIEETDFTFLYDTEKKLFTIGYNLDNARKDQSFYDLFASEARLSSLVAIAKGDVPQEHWFMTNRSLTNTPGGLALLSWSGTMFEYLMPLLVNKDYPGTLVSESCRSAVKTQKIYARKSGLPVWGISESGFSRINFEKDYQYKAFGVPDLGLKRGLSDDLVVSPYSTFLALSLDPQGCVENLRHLEKLNMRGEYGFYEAIDFTTDRLSPDEKSHIVASFFAHHQGMSVVAMNNLLNTGICQERFHADPLIKAVELLLHEKFPDNASSTPSRQAEVSRYLDERGELEAASRGEVFTTPHTAYPRTRLISNGRLSTMIDNSGSGHLFYDGEISLTRWREDALSNYRGYYIFLRDLETHRVWSSTYEPTRKEPDSYEVIFNPEKVEIRRTDYDIHVHTDITVSPEDDVEVRRLSIGNLGKKPRRLDVTSFAEVVLGSRRGDSAHPAFSKMFVESDYLPEYQTLLFSRRKRSDDEQPLYMIHRNTLPIVWAETLYESSRAEFIGRGRTIRNAAALEAGATLSKTVGPVLDPIFSLRTLIELNPGETHTINFITGIARSMEDAVRLASRYQEVSWSQRAFEIAWSQRNIELRQDQVSVAQMHVFERLANGLLFNIPPFRAPAKVLQKNRMGQSALWRFGISGDLPIVLLQISDPEQLPIARELLQAHHYLRQRGFHFDLIIFNEYPGGYLQNFQGELEMMIRSSPSAGLSEKRGGVFLRTPQQLSPDELTLVLSVARVTLNGSAGSLRRQLRLDQETLDIGTLETGPSKVVEKKPAAPAPREALELFNGIGGFANDGRTYVMHVSEKNLPPLPWSNVLSNEHFGALVTESGGGYTWSENSREYRLTPWGNDPVSDERGEAIYFRDTSTAEYWSPTPLPCGGDTQFTVRHHFGYSEFEGERNGLASKLTISGSRTEKVKWYHLQLTNQTAGEHTFEVYFYTDWVLGVEREEMYRHVVTGFDKELQFLHATNHYNMDFPGRVAFMGTSDLSPSYTANRREFIGRHGDLRQPYFFLSEESEAKGRVRGEQWRLLSSTVGAGTQPCGLIKVNITLSAKEKRDVLFYLGDAPNIDEARRSAARFRLLATRTSELEAVKNQWNTTTASVQVRTPERSMDIMLNGWLPYQTMACRLFGRSAFYQSGGAIGFRDQLQDVMALIYSHPELTRRQILLHASRMFIEGDVQHWWHPPMGRGIRTKITDNYLWLPFVTARYIEVTGDAAILDESVGFITGPSLEGGHMESMFIPGVSGEKSSLYDHCLRALRRGMMVGPHGLPLIGGGDWNDGMNLVGKEGKGESVWLAWFIIEVIKKFMPLVKSRSDMESEEIFPAYAESLREAVEKHAWDGEWYRRAYFDDGTPIGSKQNDECQIDSLTQSWAIISGAGNPERAEFAFRKACEVLVRPNDNLIALLSPPFDKGTLKPGYIKGYLPGIRENGGQYTHAATWMILAAVMRGEGTRAVDMFQLINPARITSTQTGAAKYQGEPYVMCGDVYSMAPHVGRAGWSWYTGSSGWMYRVGIENILGLQLFPDHFMVNPTIPANWKGFDMTVVKNGVTYSIEVRNPNGVEHGITAVTLNGQNVPSFKIPYAPAEDRLARVEVTLG